MNPNFPDVDVSEALAFGWGMLPRFFREQGLFCACVGVVCLSIVAIAGAPKSTSTQVNEANWVLMCAAIASAARGIDPSYRMTVKKVLGLFVLGILVGLAAALCVVPVLVIVFRAHVYGAAWLFIAIGPLMIWVLVKAQLAAVTYALLPDDRRSIVEAWRLAWEGVSGGTWWRVVGIGLCIALCVGIPGGIIAVALLFAFQGANPTLAALAFAAVTFCVSAIGTAWQTGSFVAIAAGVRPSATITD